MDKRDAASNQPSPLEVPAATSDVVLPCQRTSRPIGLTRAVASDRHCFAAKVRAARALLGWSQTDLARLAGLSQRSIYRLELAAVDIRRSTMVALESVFADAGIKFEQSSDGGFKIVVAGNGGIRQ
jgi:ribosome-binding protein aMBF1 (putative translation factor)